jgi:predicted cupin superfamily sugar epimerase
VGALAIPGDVLDREGQGFGQLLGPGSVTGFRYRVLIPALRYHSSMQGAGTTSGQLIAILGLSPDPVGGWTCEVQRVAAPAGARAVACVVNHLFDASSPGVDLHRSSADVMHYFHQGDPVSVVTVSPEGRVERSVLGNDADAGQHFQVEVSAGWWRALQISGENWSLISEAFAPASDPGDREYPSTEMVGDWFESLGADIDPPAVSKTDRSPSTRAPDASTTERLALEAHLEGGFYRQTYESEVEVSTPGGSRPLMNSIHYLLTAASPFGALHRNRSDITHFHHLGGPATYLTVARDGTVSEVLLGADLRAGHVPSFTVPAGWWKASHIQAVGAVDCLISEMVAPGFRFEDHEMATIDNFGAEHPESVERLRPYIGEGEMA